MRTLEMDYGHGDQVASHCHAEDQLIYAASGVMRVSSAGGDWVIPGGHALWVPAGVSHAIRMQGMVSMRTLLLDAGIACCQVIVVSSLLRELILAASRMLDRRDGEHARALILNELSAARRIHAFVPTPSHPRLRAWCEGFLQDPAQDLTLAQCGAQLNLSARSVARLFQRELGMSYGEWRARARVMLSQQCLAQGQPILNVALEHGYQSASAFTAMFKRILGYAPSDWQHNLTRGH
ncbi:helix-turn-helix transcriptional regulator [Pseudomonas juntendi]|jgi:AraC-like DNA-binding protein|uniref:Helix-turn-helix transcriptional regulator n=1 Tax=Pseudomonas juntendi TaxID=2666183 RepID=A0ABD4YC70_9PSED|nr:MULTISPECIES: helix-turn-helix transcriptional regulator [Pseudomonas]MBH3372811.1 helix-turn-helix transcriptional regulator [Pseudomonas juntendi]MBS6039059.1 helix-turn-helix transcriptional regulator [Pseudomonas sp.]MDH0756425.1 helix-turn-helix transcriptional regulator [Pseudomonas juntendi]MDH1917712.1 helix-turn-helix transcriptional regulator [Pseudomonas juntendi]MDH2013209.1 helix-turn-helix transcriptional regulator [Pseudomonas juntendi]